MVEYIDNCTFSDAIRLVKLGRRIRRAGWNGKNQYVELATNISYINLKNEVINANHDAIGSSCLAFVGTSGVQLGWLASQADMLAEDWEIEIDSDCESCNLDFLYADDSN